MNINVKDVPFGAKGDLKTRSHGSIDKEDLSKLCVLDAGFNANDIGKIIRIAKPGNKVAVLKTEIKDLIDSNVIILKSPATNATPDFDPGLDVTWGTDDKLAIQKAVDSAGPGDTIFFPPGIYCAHRLYLKPEISLVSLEAPVRSAILPDSPEGGISFISSKDAVLTQFIGDDSPFFFSESGKLTNVTLRGLIFDGNIDHNNTTCILLGLGSKVNGHSRFKFLDCEIKNFSYGIYVRGRDHSSFEFNGCRFEKTGGFCIGFENTNTIDIRITDCKFTDCLDGIQIYPNSKLPENEEELIPWNTCDQVLIERCHFSGDMRNPIHFGGGSFHNPKLARKPDFRLAASHVTVKGCTVTGHDRWWWDYTKRGSADQIALYGVDHFTVAGNVSNQGGDGGIVIQESQRGTITGNTCNENFGPGIYILSSSFINVNGNACMKNCRRILLPVKKCGDEGKKFMLSPAGIMLSGGSDFLITNNLCWDNTLPATKATQLYGLTIFKGTEKVTVGSDIVGSNLFIGMPDSGRGGGEVFVESPAKCDILKSYDEYLSKNEVIGY